MIAFGVILLFMAAVFGIVAVLIYRGKTELIHDYHRQRVTDQVVYGKAFGKAMAVIPIAMTLSGGIALFGETVMWLAVAVLAAGILAGIIAICRVQKKYNGGVFS